MSGHSKWKNIRYRKELVDKKRGKIFSKISRLISMAAKEKGADPETNPKLKLAIEKAKEFNIPKENIERAIKRGTGQLEGAKMEEFIYEAYGPAGVALIIEGITDNKNRTLAEIKHVLGRFDGKLADSGSVKYLFEKKGEDWEPKYPIEITDQKTIDQLDKLIEAFEENEDIQDVYKNYTIIDSVRRLP